MRIYVKRENHDKGIWMELPVTGEAAEQVRRELEKRHPSVMMPYVAEMESRFPEIEKGLIGELVFQGDNLETFNRLAGSLDALSRKEGLLFQAAYRMEAPQSADQILKTLGHLDSYRLHPEIKSLEELGRYLKQEEAAQIPEELDRFVDYQEIGRIWQGDHGFLTEGGFVEKRREPAVQAGVEEQKTQKREKRPGIFAVTLIRDSFKDRYVRFTLPLPETELAEKKRQAGLTEEIPERVEISAAIDGLLEHLMPGSTLEELNQAAKVIEEVEACSGIDWKLTLAALEAELPGTMEGCCHVIREHKTYEFLPFPFLEPESYAHYHLEQAGISIPEKLAAYFDYRRYGQEKIDWEGVTETFYGVVKNREHPISHGPGKGRDFKLYSPLAWSGYTGMPWLPELFTRARRETFQQEIREKIARDMREYGKGGLAETLSNQLLARKVSSMVPDVEEHQGKLWGVLKVSTAMELTDREMEGLKEEWKTIAAYGWGEQFACHALEGDHVRFYVDFWDTERGTDLFLLSEEEFGREVGGFEIRM